MIPNYKRPQINDYIFDILERPMTDEDLEMINYLREIEKENKELKKQLENCYCNRTDCSGRIKDSKVYDSLFQKVETQQKEFIKYLEDEIKELQKIKETELDYDILKDVISQLLDYKEILQKYKETIGVLDEKEN